MDFEKAVSLIGTVTDLRRVASAHVIDHNQLKDDDLRSALVKSKPQYAAAETVKKAIDELLSREPKDHLRALNHILLVDVLLDQYDCQLPFEETDAKVIAVEQNVLDRSNELDLEQLACGDKSTPRHRDLDTYNFVLGVAWEQRDSVSPDEANLLSNLRRHLRVNQFEHRVLEAKLRRFPKTGNELHTRAEITAARRALHNAGLLFCIRQDGVDYDVIPDELATELRAALGIELRTDAYRELFKFHRSAPRPTSPRSSSATAPPSPSRTRSTSSSSASSSTSRPPKPSPAPHPASASRATSSATGAATSTSPRPVPSTPEAWGCRVAARIAEAPGTKSGAVARRASSSRISSPSASSARCEQVAAVSMSRGRRLAEEVRSFSSTSILAATKFIELPRWRLAHRVPPARSRRRVRFDHVLPTPLHGDVTNQRWVVGRLGFG
jgi:hypothetical protein